MTKAIILALSLLLINLSCKEEKREFKEEIYSMANEGITVVVEGVFEKNDRFSLFYERSDAGYYADDKKVDAMVYGSPVIQKLVFELPEDVEPSGLRINFGVNKSQKVITLKNISVLYENKEIDGDNGEFRKYFNLKNQMEYDDTNFVYVIKSDGTDYSPSLSGNEDLRNELVELMTPTKSSDKEK